MLSTRLSIFIDESFHITKLQFMKEVQPRLESCFFEPGIEWNETTVYGRMPLFRAELVAGHSPSDGRPLREVALQLKAVLLLGIRVNKTVYSDIEFKVTSPDGSTFFV